LSKLSYALFGGSFDPPHLGHKEIIKSALEVVDKVIVVPTFLNPFKSSFSADAPLRYSWCKEVFASSNVLVSDYEIKQQRAVYSVDTYKELSKKYNIVAITIGADNLASIDRWRDFEYLNSNLTWLVATRGDKDLDCSKLRDCKKLNLGVDVSSTELRAGKKLEYIDKKIKKQVLIEYNIAI